MYVGRSCVFGRLPGGGVVAGIRVGSDWITGYAKTAEQAGDDLTKALEAVRATPLTSAAFGEVGRQLGTADAYNGAADMLQQQVTRAAAALHAAAGNLRKVATQHSTSDEEVATTLRAVGAESAHVSRAAQAGGSSGART